MEYFILFFSSVLLSSKFLKCSASPDCEALDKFKNSLRKENIDLLCSFYSDCTGLNCSGEVQGKKIQIGLQLHNCDVSTTLSLFIDVPQLGIHAWKKDFSHSDSFYLTGQIHGQLNFKNDGKNIVMGLKLKSLPIVQKYLPTSLGTTMEFTVLPDVTIPVPPCDKSYVTMNIVTSQPTTAVANMLQSSEIGNIVTERSAGNCSIYNSSCESNQMCKQLNESVDSGICICLPLYMKSDTGECIFINKTVPTTETIPIHGSVPDAHSNSASNKFLLEVILLPICVAILMAFLIYVTIRFRIFQKLRNHFRIQVYEHVLLGQQDDNDEPLTDPVV